MHLFVYILIYSIDIIDIDIWMKRDSLGRSFFMFVYSIGIFYRFIFLLWWFIMKFDFFLFFGNIRIEWSYSILTFYTQHDLLKWLSAITFFFSYLTILLLQTILQIFNSLILLLDYLHQFGYLLCVFDLMLMNFLVKCLEYSC